MLDFISKIFEPAAKLIDEVHVSDEERGKLRNELARIQADMQAKSVELMKAEASSDHWIVAAWRPMCALFLFGTIVLDSYGIGNAPQSIYSLAEIFLTTYAGGRSLEKVTKVFKK